MKTLDKVIEALEWCIDDSHDDCDGCPYDTGEVTDCHDRNVDALHYLKEYRERQENLDQFETYQFEQNRPLSWNELRQMEGKPVWVEDGLENGEWCIIECFTDSGRFIAHDRYADDTVFKAVDMGNDWQAYRKERNE